MTENSSVIEGILCREYTLLHTEALGHEANHSSPSSAEVKNAWSSASIPHTSSLICLVKHTLYTLTLVINVNKRQIRVGILGWQCFQEKLEISGF
jgi:hypothetical protein